MERATLATKSAACYIGISTWLLYQKTKSGEIPHFKVGGKILFRRETLDKWMAEQEKKSIK